MKNKRLPFRHAQSSITFSMSADTRLGIKVPSISTAHVVPSTIGPKVQLIALRDIVVGEGHRPLDNVHVEKLVDSVKRIGLSTPIFVAREKASGVVTLVAGRQRIEAMHRLGRTHIEAFVLDAQDPNNRLFTLSENLHRRDYRALERAEAENEWLLATQEEAGQLAQPSGKQPNDKSISKTSRALDVSRREIKRSQAIAGISPEAKIIARNLHLDDNQSALLKIATGRTADEQIKIASDLVKPRKRRLRSRGPEPDVKSPPVCGSSLPKIDWQIANTPPLSDGAEASGVPDADLDEAFRSDSRQGARPQELHNPSYDAAELNQYGDAKDADDATGDCTQAGSPEDGLDLPEFLNGRLLNERFEALEAAWSDAAGFRAAWANAPAPARTRFIREVLLIVSAGQTEAHYADSVPKAE